MKLCGARGPKVIAPKPSGGPLGKAPGWRQRPPFQLGRFPALARGPATPKRSGKPPAVLTPRRFTVGAARPNQRRNRGMARSAAHVSHCLLERLGPLPPCARRCAARGNQCPARRLAPLAPQRALRRGNRHRWTHGRRRHQAHPETTRLSATSFRTMGMLQLRPAREMQAAGFGPARRYLHWVVSPPP